MVTDFVSLGFQTGTAVMHSPLC